MESNGSALMIEESEAACYKNGRLNDEPCICDYPQDYGHLRARPGAAKLRLEEALLQDHELRQQRLITERGVPPGFIGLGYVN